jgi:hypothetical protein
MREAQSLVVLSIGKFLVKDTLPSVVVIASPTPLTRTSLPVASIKSGSPEGADLLLHLPGDGLLRFWVGFLGIYRHRCAKKRQCGCSVADHFNVFHNTLR